MVLNQFFAPMPSYSTFPSTYSEASFLAAQRRLRYRNVFLYIFALVALVLVFTLYLFGGIISPIYVYRSLRVRSRILVTGFQPFANYTVNPSLLVARSLHDTCNMRVCFTSVEVDVTPAGVANAALHIRENEYDAVVLLGLESSSKGLKLEVTAQNIEQTTAGSGWANDERDDDIINPVVPGAPRMLATTAPLQRISLTRLGKKLPYTSHLHRKPVRELWSNDAGTFACNELYYRALHIARFPKKKDDDMGNGLRPTIFVHLPPIEGAPVKDVAPIISNLAQLMV